MDNREAAKSPRGRGQTKLWPNMSGRKAGKVKEGWQGKARQGRAAKSWDLSTCPCIDRDEQCVPVPIKMATKDVPISEQRDRDVS